MSMRIDPSWVAFKSIEDAFHERRVDLFERPDGTLGFEEFRRDIEDQGRWTAVAHYSGRSYASREAARVAARAVIPWPPQA